MSHGGVSEQPMKVIIIGAGIAGLSLAQGLKKHNIQFHVYERELELDLREQSYPIRLNRDGMSALEYLLSADLAVLLRFAGAQQLSTALHINAVTADAIPVTTSNPTPIEPGSNPYLLDGTTLRMLLSRGLESNVTWGCTAISFEIEPNHVSVSFKDDSGRTYSVIGSMLVVADGANSNSRHKFLPEARLLKTEGHLMHGRTLLTPEVRDALVPGMVQRSSLIKDDSHGRLLCMMVEPLVFPNRDDMERAELEVPPDYLYWLVVVDPDLLTVPAGRPRATPRQCEDAVKELTKNWHESFRALVERQSIGQTRIVPLRSFPPALPVWAPSARMTFVGDAIHAMSAATGSGASTGLQSAYHLCRALVEQGQTAASIGIYEAWMRGYANQAINSSFIAGQDIFGQRPWEECEDYNDDAEDEVEMDDGNEN